MELLSIPDFHIKKGRPHGPPLREEARRQRILHRPSAQEEVQEEVLPGYSTIDLYEMTNFEEI